MLAARRGGDREQLGPDRAELSHFLRPSIAAQYRARVEGEVHVRLCGAELATAVEDGRRTAGRIGDRHLEDRRHAPSRRRRGLAGEIAALDSARRAAVEMRVDRARDDVEPCRIDLHERPTGRPRLLYLGDLSRLDPEIEWPHGTIANDYAVQDSKVEHCAEHALRGRAPRLYPSANC